MYQIRDPIHGFIDVSSLEMKIVDSEPFQRLRRIRQLATTHLVYPGAEHTRFGHSLGVMHLVSKAYNSALNNFKERNKSDLFKPLKKEWYEQILRLIALTHDLGHAPYSHASEALFEDGIEHEDFTKKILLESEIADYIRHIGVAFREKHNVDEEYDITPELLWLIYGEKNPELDKFYVMPDYKFLKSFMDSELDCDKMDYLLRDSYYCGVNYGTYDLNRLLSSLNVYKEERGNIIQIAIERNGIHAFEEFVIARYFMFTQVYFHKTRRILDKLLVDSIQDVLVEKKYPSTVSEYLDWDDQSVFAKIKENQNESLSAQQFIKRQVMTCVYESGTHSNLSNDAKVFSLVKRELESKLQSCKVVEDTSHKLAHKIPLMELFDAESGKGIPLLIKHSAKPASISTESTILQNLINKPINIKRLYVEKSYLEEAKKIVQNFLDVGGE